MTAPFAEERVEPVREISVATLAWISVGAVFVLVRLAGVMSIAVGGAELDGLSGAWAAHSGSAGDSRFVPTLFQALSGLSFVFTNSEMASRVLVLLASATVPFALYRLRAVFGEVPALFALLLLALDPASVLLGSTAWVGGWDLAVVLWLLVLAHEAAPPRWAFALAGFATATSGSLVLPLVVAMAGLRLFRQQYPERDTLIWSAGGAVVGLVVASVGFGFGWQGLLVPPVAALSAGFDRSWSTEHTRYLALIYSLPLIAGAVVAVGAQGFRGWRDDDWSELPVLVYAWFGMSLLWLIGAGGSQDPAPLAAVAIPAALLIGMEAPGAFAALARVEWRWAALVLGGVFLGLGVIEAYVVDWARVDRPGQSDDKLIVTGLVVAVIASLGLIASSRRTTAAVLLPPVVVGALVMFSGVSGVAFGGVNEPMPSPINSAQGSEIRAIVLEARKAKGGEIVVHPNFREAMTWPMRDSGDIVVANRIPSDATAVIWPVSEPAPEGFAIVDGQWSFTEERRGPDGGFLDYLRWLSNRNSLKNSPTPIAVYLKAGQ